MRARISPFALGAVVAACSPLELASDAGAGGGGGASAATGPLAPVSGKAFVFGLGAGSLEGATVSSVEAPERSTTVAADGTFALEVPSSADHSFLLHLDGYQDTQTATLRIGPKGLDAVGFQVPTTGMVALLGATLGRAPDPALCQIATTVSAAGTAPYGGSGVGEPGVVVAIDPPLPQESGPVYFKYVSDSIIVPDRALVETSKDGGVLYLDVPPGDYTLTATKAGKVIDPVAIRCRAGVLVNAAPPRGLQVK